MKQIKHSEFDRFQKVQKGCDHKSMPEVVNGYKVCFCTKMMHVIALNANCTTKQFVDQLGAYAYSKIDWNKVQKELRENLSKRDSLYV